VGVGVGRRGGLPLLDDHVDRVASRGRVRNGDQLAGKIEVACIGLRIARSDEQFVLWNVQEAGFDLVIELADRAEVDLEGLADGSASAATKTDGRSASREVDRAATFGFDDPVAHARIDFFLFGRQDTGLGHLVTHQSLDRLPAKKAPATGECQTETHWPASGDWRA
jgi:hypothetical protein